MSECGIEFVECNLEVLHVLHCCRTSSTAKQTKAPHRPVVQERMLYCAQLRMRHHLKDLSCLVALESGLLVSKAPAP